MRAAVIVERDGRRTLEVRDDVPKPEAGPGEVLVRVRATSLNRADLLRGAGHFGGGPDGRPPIGGLELAGEVVEVGDGVDTFRPGDRIMSQGTGGYAEFAAVDARVAMPVPDDFSWEQAGATPVVFLTAHDAVVTNGRIARGEAVLVNAASSGAGLAALQVAAAKGASPIVATTTSSDKMRAVQDNGATDVLDAGRDDLVEAVGVLTGGAGIDLTVDHVGGATIDASVTMAAIKGRIVSVGRLGGVRGELNLDELARKRLHLIGVTFRTRTADERAEVVRRFMDDLYQGLVDGRLRPVIQEVRPLEEVAEAQEAMRRNAHVGKIVLRVD